MSHGPNLLAIYSVAFDAMKVIGPSKLLARVKSEADPQRGGTPRDRGRTNGGSRRPSGRLGACSAVRTELALWDAAIAAIWTDGTDPKTDERRARIYDKLDLSPRIRQRLDELFPVAKDGGGVVVSREFEPWYAASLEDRPSFYWGHYEEFLLEKGWDPDAVANLGLNTTRIVERLADPERSSAYQAKGLVVGYVQSGKTANFTGVVAKAVDAGYRLIIVLTGTTDLLRTQTQRRLDKELVGRENLLRGIDPTDAESLSTVDYHGDPDWDAFVSTVMLAVADGRPDIYRLTTARATTRLSSKGSRRSISRGSIRPSRSMRPRISDACLRASRS